jgi:hypothetical protein
VGLMTTGEVAAEIAMSEDWVRDHAAELGAIRAGRTNRAPLRFDPEWIAEWKRAHRVGAPPADRRRRRRVYRPPAGLELLPLPPRAARHGER